MAQSTAILNQTDVGSILVLQANSGGVLAIPGESWLLKADFSPQGSDLLLTGPDGAQVLIRDYFNLDNPPDLLTDSGAMIPADLAIKLAGPAAPGQFALLENGPFAELAQAAESIGRVEATDGLVEAIRIDGTKVTLAKGDDIFQGDTLITAKGAAIGVTFVDDTTFSLGEEGRMVIDEMVYDAETQEGQFSANLVQGVFSFVSGEIAKTSPDGMTVSTPVATIGIRGTKVAGRAAQEGAENTISLLPETDAQGNQSVGELSVTNQGGTVTLSSIGATVQMTSAFQPPPPQVIFSPQQIQQNFGATLTTLSTTAAAASEANAVENEAQAEAAQAEAEQAGAEAEAAAAEAETAQGEAEAAAAEAEASGDPEAIAAAEAKAAEAEAKTAEAEAKTAEAEVAKAEAEHANAEMQAQSEAFATFGGPQPGDAPAGGDGPADGKAPPDGGQQGGDAVQGAAEEAARQAIADGATPEEAADAALEAAKAQALADGASPEEIAAGEQAYNDAIAAGASPEEAMRAASQTGQDVGEGSLAGANDGGDPNAPGGFTGDPNAPDGFTGDPNSPDGGGFNDGGGNFSGGGDLGGANFFGGGGDPFFGGGGDLFGGGGDMFGGGDPFFGGGDTGFYGDPIYGGAGGDAFYDPYSAMTFGDINDPIFGDIFTIDPVLYDPTTNTYVEQVVTQSSFTATYSGTTGNDTLNGDAGNSNFYFSETALGGTDVITDAGGSDQLAFDGLDNTVIRITNASGTSPDTANIWTTPGGSAGYYYASSFSGSGSTNISFSDIEQYLFSDTTVASLSGGYTAQTSETSATSGTDTAGDIMVLPALLEGEAGLVMAGRSSVDYFTFNDPSLDGAIVFGKGDGDNFYVNTYGDRILIGGITATDNTDTQTLSTQAGYGVPDGGLNWFRYDGNTDVTNAGHGLNITLYGDVTYETGGSGNVGEKTTSNLNDLIWDVSKLTASTLGDTINIFGGGYTLIDAGAGNDAITASNGSRFGSILGGAGNDQLSLYVSTLTEGGNVVNAADAVTINGDTGTTDTLTILGGGTLTANQLSKTTLWETFSLGTDAAYNITLNTANFGGTTLAFNAATVTTAGNLVKIDAAAANNMSDVLNLTVASSALNTTTTVATLTGAAGSGSDSLTFIGGTGADTLDATELANLTAWEIWSLGTNANYNIALNTGNAATSGTGTLTVSAANVTSATVNFDASAETNDDIIYVGGAGTDNLTVATAMLDDTFSHSLNGGAGTSDNLTFSAVTGNLDAAELGGISNFETWTMGGDVAYTMTLAAGNVASGATLTIDASAATSAAVTINAVSEIDGTLNYTGGGGTDTLTVAQAMLTGATATLTGGGGSSDTLNISGTGTLLQGEMVNISGWETLALTNAPWDLTLDDANGGAGITTTINASAVIGSAVTLDAAAETDGNLTYNGGSGIDTFTGGGFADIINGGVGDDILNGGGGVDTIIGGTGQDTLNGGTGSDIYSYTATTDGSTTAGLGDIIATANFTDGLDSLSFLSSAFGSLTIANDLVLSTVAFNTDQATTLADFVAAAQGAPSTGWAIDFGADTTFDATWMGTLDTMLTSNATNQTGAAFFVVDNNTDTVILYDPNTANTGDMVEIATISGLVDGASANLFSGGEIDIV